MGYPPYKAVYNTVKAVLAEKGKQADSDEDPLDGTETDTFDTSQINSLTRLLFQRNSSVDDRSFVLSMWLYNVVGRFDDGRLVFQPDFLPPTQIKSIGMITTCCVRTPWQSHPHKNTVIALSRLLLKVHALHTCVMWLHCNALFFEWRCKCQFRHCTYQLHCSCMCKAVCCLRVYDSPNGVV